MSEFCPVCGSRCTDMPVCASCGFKLKGSTTKFTPIELSSTDLYSHKKPTNAQAFLRIVRGPQIGTCYTLPSEKITIGRDVNCDIFLNDMTVSRQHAFIVPDKGGYKIVNNHSFNGLWINNENCEMKRLVPNDVIQLGAFCLIYEEL